ncbi:MAG: hypothetical protein QOH91_1722 [Mycobacterium sp.]|jgi:hypothetical protein|nr:hypothetical protein [Mycobacterium sp.]
MAVADVVGQVTGREPSEQQIEGVAENTPSVAHGGSIWHPGGSTNNLDLPVLLTHYGVRSTIVNANTSALEQELAQGHKVIAGLNSQILWNGRRHLRKVVGYQPQLRRRDQVTVSYSAHSPDDAPAVNWLAARRLWRCRQ